MKKTYLVIIIVVLCGSVFMTTATKYNNLKNAEKGLSLSESEFSFSVTESDSNNISANWNIYSNQEIGISFKYPKTWASETSVSKSSTEGASVANVDFIDTTTQTTFSIVYHFSNGRILYNDVISQYNSSTGWYKSNAKEIELGGITAIEAQTTLTVDGKGNMLKQPLRLILIDFLDRKNVGEYKFQFETPLTSESNELLKLNTLLSTFHFLD
jgi:hypothetical protein